MKYKSFLTFSLIFFILLFINLPNIHGMRIIKRTLEELGNISESIILGRCVYVKSFYENGRIYTYYTIEVTEVIKGKKDIQEVNLRHLGGSADGISMQISGMPSFKEEEEVILFLKHKNKAGFSIIAGGTQGKFTIYTINNTKFVYENIDWQIKKTKLTDFIDKIKELTK